MPNSSLLVFLAIFGWANPGCSEPASRWRGPPVDGTALAELVVFDESTAPVDTVALLDIATAEETADQPDTGNETADTPDTSTGLDSMAPGAPCDDGNACTGPDFWTWAGACVGPPLLCLDEDPCTQDHCYERVGCTHVAAPGCGAACPECPYALGFECDQTVLPATCVRPGTGESYVPSGLFWFGFDKRIASEPRFQASWLNSPNEDHSTFLVFLPGFIIDITEIDAALFYAYDPSHASFWEGDCGIRCDFSSGYPLPQFYVYYVDDYCRSLGKRLCWETEWEKAALGGCAQLGASEEDHGQCYEGRPFYPWGDATPTCEAVHYWGSCGGYLNPIGSSLIDRSAYGVLDMNGGFSEGTLAIGGRKAGLWLTPKMGGDGVCSPPGYPASLPSEENDIPNSTPTDPVSCLRGLEWEPSCARAVYVPMFSAVPRVSARCCRDVDPADVVPAGAALPWPPELQ